jgi:hypothetical protein
VYFLGIATLRRVLSVLIHPKYISRDIVFYEHVFPFATLHPNAGARLRKELSLLPDVLLNPSSKFGDAILFDQHNPDSMSTNPPRSAIVPCVDTGENVMQNGENLLAGGRHSMCRLLGDNSGTPLDVGSADNMQPHAQQHATSPNSSVPSGPHVATQLDPKARGIEVSPSASDLGAVVILPSGSSTAPAATTPSDSTPPVDTTPPWHPVTRLQRGISRPKI